MSSAVLFACAALQASVRLWTCLRLSQFALAVDVPGCAHVPMPVHPPLGFAFCLCTTRRSCPGVKGSSSLLRGYHRLKTLGGYMA